MKHHVIRCIIIHMHIQELALAPESCFIPPSLLGCGGRPFPKCICCILWLTAVTLCVMTQCGAMQQEVEEVTQSAHHDSQVAAASTQTVHLTIAMLIAMASETRQTMLGANRCCLEQIRLRRMCQTANISEVDLTSGEKSLMSCIPSAKKCFETCSGSSSV